MIREWNRGEWTRDRDAFSEAGVFAPKQAESETDKDPLNPKASYLAKGASAQDRHHLIYTTRSHSNLIAIDLISNRLGLSKNIYDIYTNFGSERRGRRRFKR
jgi:hypothetical protein